MPNLNVPSLNVAGISSSSIKEISVRGLGDYIREQRRSAQISLRQLARQAGVSNPYLSQIERGLRKPSAEILQQIAKALRISAEALYVQAGILEEREGTELAQALLYDPHLTERQKQVLIEIYDSFRKENEARTAAEMAGETAAAEGVDITVSDKPVLSMAPPPAQPAQPAASAKPESADRAPRRGAKPASG
jgi:transcriptional regulator with XRE-family HTH domain